MCIRDSGRTAPQYDLGEVDQLIGGAGRDTFIVGLERLFYNDASDANQVAASRRSTDNRALVTDFNRQEDTLLLSALNPRTGPPADLYRVVERDGDTFVYLRDGTNPAGAADPARNELIAELDGVTGFNLKSAYVLYYTADGRYLRGDGTEVDPPAALDGALGHDHLLPPAGDAAPVPAPIVLSTCVCVCAVFYTHPRAHENVLDLVCRLRLEKKKHLFSL